MRSGRKLLTARERKKVADLLSSRRGKLLSIRRGRAAPVHEDAGIVPRESDEGITEAVPVESRDEDNAQTAPVESQVAQPAAVFPPFQGIPGAPSKSSTLWDDASSKSSEGSASSTLSAATEAEDEEGSVGSGASVAGLSDEGGTSEELSDESGIAASGEFAASESSIDCFLPSLSMVSKSELPLEEARTAAGPKYYVAANTRAGQARVVHEAMPADADFQDAEEKGFEVLEYYLVGGKHEEEPEGGDGSLFDDLAHYFGCA